MDGTWNNYDGEKSFEDFLKNDEPLDRRCTNIMDAYVNTYLNLN